MKKFKTAVAAGVMISVGAAAYLSCENRILGAFLFSVALFTICSFGLSLYTGLAGYFFELKNKSELAVVWLGNLAGSLVGSLLIRLAKPSLSEKAAALFGVKFGQSIVATAALAMFCGIMMYTAVRSFNESDSGTQSVFGVAVCIMTFIMCGFEHSIADMCYLWLAVGSAGTLLRGAGYILVVSLFNAFGAVAFKSIT